MAKPAPTQLVADACFLLNLAATGREAEILRSLGVTLIAHDDVLAEALYLIEEDAEGQRVKVPVAFMSLEEEGLLLRRSLGRAGLRSFVKAAVRLTDRDAKAVGIASEMAAPLITDDRCIRNFVTVTFPEIPLRSTLELVKEAASVLSLGADELGKMLRMVRQRGNFAPPRDDPNAEWYRQVTAPPT